MARARRHKHHSRKSRSNWAVMGAFVASAAFAPRLAAPAHATDLARRLESLRIAVPGETRLARALPAQAPARRPAPAALRHSSRRRCASVLAEIERISGVSIVVTDAAIADISSAGVSGLFTPLEAIARALEGTSVTSRVTGPNSVSLEIRLASEAVDVTGAIPQPRPSSPKYAQPLIEVPQTIEVIPREVMEAQGVTTLSEALRNVPGISLQAGEGGGASNTSGDMFNLRGFSANNSLFVDGVRDDGLMSRDVFNLEQVEVFMGPTGSDVGRGNAAGYVNMQTKAPHAESAYAVSYGYGSGDLNRTTVDLNQELALGAHDSWLGRSAVRLNALWEDGGVAGRDIVDAEEPVGRAVDRAGLGHADARHGRRADYATGQPARLRNSRLRVVGDAACADDGHRGRSRSIRRNFYGSVGYDFDKVEQESYTGRVEHDINSSLTLRNQTRYNQTHRTAVITAVQIAGELRARHADGDAGAAGQRAREHDPVESDEPRGAIRDRRAAPRGERRHRDRVRRAVRAGAGRPWHARSRQHLRPEPVRSGHRTMRPAARPCLHQGQDEYGRRLCVRHRRARRPMAAQRRSALGALRRGVQGGRRARRRDDRPDRWPTACSAARPACSTGSPSTPTCTSRTDRPSRRPAPRISRSARSRTTRTTRTWSRRSRRNYEVGGKVRPLRQQAVAERRACSAPTTRT